MIDAFVDALDLAKMGFDGSTSTVISIASRDERIQVRGGATDLPSVQLVTLRLGRLLIRLVYEQ